MNQLSKPTITCFLLLLLLSAFSIGANLRSLGGAWDLVEVRDSGTRAWKTFEVKVLEARSYVAGARLGGQDTETATTTALVAGGDFQNGTTTDLVDFLTPN